MSFEFTAKWVRALANPAADRQDYWDSSVPGFGLRAYATGRRTWVYVYRPAGSPTKLRFTIGNYPALSLADARDVAKDKEREVAKGGNPQGEKLKLRGAITFGQLADEYIERHVSQKKSGRNDRQIIEKELRPKWGARKAGSISRQEVADLLEKIRKRAPIQANRTLEIIRKIFNFGIDKGLVQNNPAHRMGKPSKENKRERVLTPTEIGLFWGACEAESALIAGVFRLLLATGQRKSEVLGLRFTEIDEDDAWWTIPGARSKNGLPHRVPLSDLARSIIAGLRELTGSLPVAFPSPSDFAAWKERRNDYDPATAKPMTSVNKAAGRIFKAAGIVDGEGEPTAIPHDLRRTVTTNLSAAGVVREVVKRILNHKDPGITAEHYDQYAYAKEKQAALDGWGRRLVEIVSRNDA